MDEDVLNRPSVAATLKNQKYKPRTSALKGGNEWNQSYDPKTGNVFYINKKTGEMKWETPIEFLQRK